MRAKEFITEKWTKKYKSSINCNNPKGFSQRAHCQGRTKEEDYHPNDRPPGPETKPTMPPGTVRVDVSDVYDWYKLGQHISDLKGLGKHDFGKGPPSTIFSFGSEDEEHKYIKDLEKSGLTTTDIDPIDPNQPKGMKRQKVDPTYNVNESPLSETDTVVRIDSKPIKDFASNLKAYKHTDDWSQSGIDTGDDSYWQKRNIKPNITKGLYAGDPHRTALYATGNAHQTRYVEFTKDGQDIVYFDKKDLPAIRSRKTYLTVFDADNFKKLPTGEYFSNNPGEPLKQQPIGDPFQYITDHGWIVRITDDIEKVFKQVQAMHKAGKISHIGAEGMDSIIENFADGKNPQDKGDSKRYKVPTKGKISTLRKIAKQGGRKGQLAHWLANMKSGRAKKK